MKIHITVFIYVWQITGVKLIHRNILQEHSIRAEVHFIRIWADIYITGIELIYRSTIKEYFIRVGVHFVRICAIIIVVILHIWINFREAFIIGKSNSFGYTIRIRAHSHWLYATIIVVILPIWINSREAPIIGESHFSGCTIRMRAHSHWLCAIINITFLHSWIHVDWTISIIRIILCGLTIWGQTKFYRLFTNIAVLLPSWKGIFNICNNLPKFIDSSDIGII